MSELPWFPLYVDKFLGSRRVRRMSAEQVGIYLLLLCEQWKGGPIPDSDEDLIRFTLVSASKARVVLEQCFSLTSEGWVNPELLRIEEEQDVKRARRARAGSKGGKKKAANRVAMLQQDSSNALAVDKSRGEESRKEKKKNSRSQERVIPEVGDENTLKSNELLAEWIKRQGSPPDTAERSKQAGKAKQICAKHSKDDIRQAFVGMGSLYPHSDGEPWDLFDLDKKFSKAKQAVVNHPKVKEMQRRAELEEEIGSV